MVVVEKTGDEIIREKYSPIFMKYVPKEVAFEFRKFAKDNASGHYGTALRMLLDAVKWSEELSSLKQRIEILESGDNPKTTKPRFPKTIGERNE